MNGTGTRENILNAAEALFAERGYAATSLRAITQAAGANLAAVNYHFGSKEHLLGAVVIRRVAPLNDARLRLLDECEAGAKGAAPSLEAVLHAFIAPVFTLRDGETASAGAFPNLIGRLYSESLPSLTTLYSENFAEMMGRFQVALRRALPGLAAADLAWRLEFVVGMLTHTLMAGDRLALVTGGLCDPTDVDGLTRRMVRFAAAGMRAPWQNAERALCGGDGP